MRSRRVIAGSILLTLLLAAAVTFTLGSQIVRGSGVARAVDAPLVSFTPVSDAGSASCTWETAAPLAPQPPGFIQRPAVAGVRGEAARIVTFNDAGDPTDRPAASAHLPLRFIQDPYPSFSAVEVDTARNEVVLMDGNRFSVRVYDRLANTPAGASHSEPKRAIGGTKTLSQFPSDVYVDPANGDIYVPNNDSLLGLNVFSRNQDGNVPPARHLKSAAYGSYGIAVDEERKEMLFTIQHDGAIAIWKKDASGSDLPVRLIQGNKTRMGDPHGIALDAKNGLLYVVNFGTRRDTKQQPVQPDGKPRVPNWPAGNLGLGGIGAYRYEVVLGTGAFDPPSITVFQKNAEGNVAPLRVIQGPKTQLNWPTGVAIDPDRNEVYVANDIGQSITVYNATANGDEAPIRVIKGSKTALKNPTGVFVDTVNNELWVANFGDHSATVYPRTANGDVEPIRTIRTAPRGTPTTFINNPNAIVYDTRREEILVPNCVQHPRIAAFPVMSDKGALPVRTIEGQKTMLNRTMHSIGYDDVHDEIVTQSNIGQAILTFRGAANGDEAPIRVIQGKKTMLRDPEKVALDPVNNEIYVLNMTIDDEVLVFDRLAQGDVAPKRILKGPDTMLDAGNMAIDPINNLLIVTGGKGILMYERTASGNAKPVRLLPGARGAGAVRVYPPSGMIVTNVRDRENGLYTGVWHVTDSGMAKARWMMGKGMLKETRGVTFDPKNKTVIISDKLLAGVLTYSLPEMFVAPATTTARR